MNRNDHPEKAKAPGGQAGGFQGNKKTDNAKCSAKSTTAEAQRQRILDALRTGPKTSYELRRLGAYSCAARVKELRDRFGYVIRTERVTLWDQDGFEHTRSALYVLDTEPKLRKQPRHVIRTGSKVVP
ncbi:helix-turn-helix domain-containing protein [Hydrogenophaga sp.]|uniref:helix-turn-helix domain-containing protein n=1 Tax=Hydrogenophaga sp. TaxID=1904254 RepID=UPI0025C0BC07|nr:helix-turn-helix domain-containing protein [Hydrogenophaga sp.]MBT9462542.1 helix-turn-helix domain-containing protein [Hydrogenophaga sp.]